MKAIRRYALALAACCLFAFAPVFGAPVAGAHAGPAPAPGLDAQLIGIWQDDHDPDNIIQFQANHEVRIYVPKRAGEASNLHWIEGTWVLRGRTLTLTLESAAAGTSRMKTFTVAFSRGRLVVKARGKVVGTQHRITEQALQQRLW